jgi:hypothetical protein
MDEDVKTVTTAAPAAADPYAAVSAQEQEPDPNDPALAKEGAPEPDLDDPALATESHETDANADSYAIAPPIPDGKWRAKLNLIDIDKQNKSGKSPDKWILAVATWQDKDSRGKYPQFFAFNLQATVIDLTNHYDGAKLTEFWCKTEVDRRKAGASPAATVIRKSGGIVPEGTPQIGVRDIMLKHMAGEPEAIIETQWIARCQHCEEEAEKKGTRKPRPFKRGERNFPLIANSDKKFVKHDPVVKCPTCESTVRAQAAIVQYFTVNEARPSFTPQNTPVVR